MRKKSTSSVILHKSNRKESFSVQSGRRDLSLNKNKIIFSLPELIKTLKNFSKKLDTNSKKIIYLEVIRKTRGTKYDTFIKRFQIHIFTFFIFIHFS